MNFDLTEEQLALQASLGRLLTDLHGHEARRCIAASKTGWSEPIWRQTVEMGLAALLVPEDHGGLGRPTSDLFVVLQEIGRSLLATPLVSSSLIPAAVLQAAADDTTQRTLLAPLSMDDAHLIWAHDEANGDGGPFWIETFARKHGSGWRLEGAKVCVPFGGAATEFLVTARIEGAPDAVSGRALFRVSTQTPGVFWSGHRLTDGTPAGTLTLRDVESVPITVNSSYAAAGIEAGLSIGIACACAEMLGCMEAAFSLTQEYMNTREQFGRTIGQNQALRHTLADMLVSLEMARSMAMAAAVQAGRPHDSQARCDLARAKLAIGRYARALTEAAIQLHGGMGMTEEYPVGACLCRVHVLDQLFGNTSYHAAVLARGVG